MITSTTIFGFFIAEPTTALTDFILSVLCVVFFFQFSQSNKEKGLSSWRYFFLFMGISTFLGAITHAVFLSPEQKNYHYFWLSMQLFSGLSVYFAQLATIQSITNSKIPIYKSEKTSLLICRIQFIVFAIAVLFYQNFLVVVINSTLGFLMVLYIHALSGKKYGNRPAGWIAAGITISFMTAIVYTLKLSFNQWFNFKDIAHVIMMVSICFIFYGVAMAYQPDEEQETAKSNTYK
jgi:hypothetical protein